MVNSFLVPFLWQMSSCQKADKTKTLYQTVMKRLIYLSMVADYNDKMAFVLRDIVSPLDDFLLTEHL